METSGFRTFGGASADFQRIFGESTRAVWNRKETIDLTSDGVTACLGRFFDGLCNRERLQKTEEEKSGASRFEGKSEEDVKYIVKQFNPDRLKLFSDHLMASSSRIQRMFLNTFIFKPVTIIAKFSRLAEQSGISQMHALGNNQLTAETILELHGHTSETEKAGFFNCGDLSFFDRMSVTLLQDDRTREFFQTFIDEAANDREIFESLLRGADVITQEQISRGVRAGVEYLFSETLAGESFPSAVVEYGTRRVGVGLLQIIEKINEVYIASTDSVLVAYNVLRLHVQEQLGGLYHTEEGKAAWDEANKTLFDGKTPFQANKILSDYIKAHKEALADFKKLYLDGEKHNVNLTINTLPRALTLLNLEVIFYSMLNAQFHIPRWIGEFKDLKELILIGCQITEVPEGIGALNNLRHLDLSGNLIGEIPRVIFDMVGLVSLSLDSNQIQAVSPDIRRLSALKVLSLSNNPIGDAIFQQLSGLNHLPHLTLTNTGLTVLPTLEQLCRLESLNWLSIDENQMLVELETAEIEAWEQEISLQHPHNQIPDASPLYIDIDTADHLRILAPFRF